MAHAIHGLSFDALERELTAGGLPAAHTRTLWRALHRQPIAELTTRTDFLPPLQRWVRKHLVTTFAPNADFHANLPPQTDEIVSTDGLTRKFLLALGDGQVIETVLMGYPGRHTACVSTQAGCAMGCVFCATGQMGFVRHLEPGEIVAQVLHCRAALQSRGAGDCLRNLVLMGMGEPLHNYDAVMEALGIITDSRGINLAPSRVSISTVGVVPGILRLAEERRPYNLAVSLHGASEEERNALVPAGRRWPLAELIGACREYSRATNRKIFFEWTLIEGQNDSLETAARLASLLAGLNAHINLIPLNPTNSFSGLASGSRAVDGFQRVLRDAGFPATVRQRRGIDVAAGCGQLRAEKTRRAGAPAGINAATQSLTPATFESH